MTQLATRLHFSLEPPEKVRVRGPLGRDHLDRNDAGGSKVGRKVDIPHSARPELIVDSVLSVENFANHVVWSGPAAMIA